jgi:hypothetical protein
MRREEIVANHAEHSFLKRASHALEEGNNYSGNLSAITYGFEF